ncbi:MAG: hypothetical protein QXO68_07155 [Conexivisphaerales archaeon]
MFICGDQIAQYGARALNKSFKTGFVIATMAFKVNAPNEGYKKINYNPLETVSR